MHARTTLTALLLTLGLGLTPGGLNDLHLKTCKPPPNLQDFDHPNPMTSPLLRVRGHAPVPGCPTGAWAPRATLQRNLDRHSVP